MARKRDKQRQDTSGGAGPLTSSPFARLADLRERLAPAAGEGERAPADSTVAGTAAGPVGAAPPPRRAVVRYQRKGRGGKEVTLVEQLDLPPAALEAWLKDLKQSLGCGGMREGEVLVLQGDQRERLPELLRRRGVARVS